MNETMERAMNSENLGARIMKNEALDQKIMAFKALVAKRSFLEVLGQFLEFSDWLEGLVGKRQGFM
jgi:hypothetical protein